MSVYKEGFYAVEEIQNQSKQIYQDACDYGAPVKVGDSLWNWVKQACEWYGVKGTRKVSCGGKQVDMVISLMNEWTPPYKTHYFKISYFKTGGNEKNFDGFFEVSEIKSAKEISEFKSIESKQYA